MKSSKALVVSIALSMFCGSCAVGRGEEGYQERFCGDKQVLDSAVSYFNSLENGLRTSVGLHDRLTLQQTQVRVHFVGPVSSPFPGITLYQFDLTGNGVDFTACFFRRGSQVMRLRCEWEDQNALIPASFISQVDSFAVREPGVTLTVDTVLSFFLRITNLVSHRRSMVLNSFREIEVDSEDKTPDSIKQMIHPPVRSMDGTSRFDGFVWESGDAGLHSVHLEVQANRIHWEEHMIGRVGMPSVEM